jgi:hypothetical protein
MIPDWLIYDEIKRRREQERERDRLELPLYRPEVPEDDEEERRDEEGGDGSDRGVVIIDMNDGTEIG